MTRESLRLLFDYHYWARDRMLTALARLSQDDYVRSLGGSFGSIRETAVHIYSADWVWHSRWQGVSPTAMLGAEALGDVAALTAAWADLEGRVRHLLDEMTEADLTRELDYHLMSGQPGRSVFWHMAQHVVNHATYHRGQVTTLLRQIGAAPPASMDLIAFYRDRQAGALPSR